MADVMEAIHAAIRDVDPAIAERYPVAIKPGEHVIGTLGDLPRRLLALETLSFEQLSKLLLEHERIHRDPILLDDPDLTDQWVARSRACRARIDVLKALFTFAVYEQFPQSILRDYLVVREGLVLVWCEKFDSEEENRVGSAVGEIFSRQPGSKD